MESEGGVRMSKFFLSYLMMKQVVATGAGAGSSGVGGVGSPSCHQEKSFDLSKM